MAVGESPKVAISSPAQYCGLRLRRGTRIRELPEEHEVVQRWCEALGQEYRGLGSRDLPEAAEGEAGSAWRGGEAEDPGRAGRQARAVRLRADSGHLRAGPRGAGEAGLCGQRANSAGAVRRLPQREDAARERAAHEFGEPRGPHRHGVRRSPKLPPLVFEAQTYQRDALYVGVDVVRCRRNGLANAPFPLPILCPADGVEPVDGVLPDLGFVVQGQGSRSRPRAAAEGGSPSKASTCCLTRCATCSSVRCAGCLVMAPPSSFTGSQSLRS